MAKMVPAGALNVQHGGELDGVTDSPVVSVPYSSAQVLAAGESSERELELSSTSHDHT